MKKILVLLLLIVASALYGSYFTISKYLLNQALDPLSIAFSVALVLSFFILISQGLIKKSREEIKKFNWKNSVPLLLLCVLVAGVSPFLLYYGQDITTATNSAFIFQLAPVFAAILGVLFFKEKLKKYFWASLALILIGLFLLTTQFGVSKPNLGDLMILLVAFLFGLYNVSAKKYTENTSSITLANLRMILGNVFVIVVVLFILKGDAFLALIKFPFFILTNSFFIYFYIITLHIGIRNFGAANTTSILTLTALFSAVFSFIFIGESLSMLQYVGGVIIILGIVILIKKR